MATTTWPSTTADDTSSGRGAKTIGLSLFQRDMVVMQAGTTVRVAGNMSDSTYATVDTFTIMTPTFAQSGMKLRLFVHMLATVSGISTFRIQDNATSTNGTDSATVTNPNNDMVESVLTWGAWTGERLINVQAKSTTGTVTLDMLSAGMNLRWSDE